jgi:hypothetical protein
MTPATALMKSSAQIETRAGTSIFSSAALQTTQIMGTRPITADAT